MLAATGVKATILDHDQFMIQPAVKPDPAVGGGCCEAARRGRSPLLIVGPEVTRSGGNREIVRLAERLSIPVAQGELLFDDFPTEHPLFVGDYGSPLPQHLEGVDLILNLGDKMPPQDDMIPSGAKVIHASIDPDMIGRVVPTDVGIVADVKEAAIDLVAALESLVTTASLDEMRDARLVTIKAQTDARRARRKKYVREKWDDRPMSWERLAEELEQRFDKDAIVVPELAYDGWLEQLSFGPGEKRKIGKTTGSALGWGVGAAIGVKLAQPDRQVVALQGDGGFMFAQAETLWTMARYEVPVIIVIFNNRSYNGPRNQILGAGGKQAQAGKDMTCYLGDPDVDFAKVAAGFGVQRRGRRQPGADRRRHRRAIASTRDGKPYLIDAVVARTGTAADSTWYPAYSVAAHRNKKV